MSEDRVEGPKVDDIETLGEGLIDRLALLGAQLQESQRRMLALLDEHLDQPPAAADPIPEAHSALPMTAEIEIEIADAEVAGRVEAVEAIEPEVVDPAPSKPVDAEEPAATTTTAEEPGQPAQAASHLRPHRPAWQSNLMVAGVATIVLVVVLFLVSHL